MPAPSSRDRLPFERKAKKKKPEKVTPPAPATAAAPSRTKTTGIPDVVGNRMVRRMALFSGIPTGLGMFSFVAFYWIVSHDWLEIPTYVVFAVSLLLFGLGVLGLSYGIFSTSWDERDAGSWWGWQEFSLNLGRTVKAWRSDRPPAPEAKEN